MDSYNVKYKKGDAGVAGMSIQDLRELLSINGFDSSGNRPELCQRIYKLLGELKVISLPNVNVIPSPPEVLSEDVSALANDANIKHPKLIITKYSDKSVVVRGDYTNEEYDDLMDLKGKYNKNLKGGRGIVFSNTHLEKVTTYINEGVLPDKSSNTVMHIESYKFIVKGFNVAERQRLVKLGGKYLIGVGIIFDENNRHTIESYILAENK